jgi:hypothetical protein
MPLMRIACVHGCVHELTVVPNRRLLRGGRRVRYDTTYFDWVDLRVDTRLIARERESWNRFLVLRKSTNQPCGEIGYARQSSLLSSRGRSAQATHVMLNTPLSSSTRTSS